MTPLAENGSTIKTCDFDYHLPPDCIAQFPAKVRDQSRLMQLHRANRSISETLFDELDTSLCAGDLLVINDTKVIPARIFVRKPTGGSADLLLTEEIAPNDWWVKIRSMNRMRVGIQLQVIPRTPSTPAIIATVLGKSIDSLHVRFTGVDDISEALDSVGHPPLPPYISRKKESNDADHSRYQTVYAAKPGSIAAPTAGLHFTELLFQKLQAKGVKIVKVTLHVGLGTFMPVKTESLSEHRMHEERFQLSAETAEEINAAKIAGRRIIAVGTTTTRVLESAAAIQFPLVATEGRTRIFIHPPYQFKVIDGLITNFHIPKSTLLMLVSAFASPGKMDGRQFILDAYAEAIRRQFRFYSYGDAMLIL